jgi:CheY-like chemotaxis protein
LPTSSFPYRILVVEDEPSLRTLATSLLQSKGYEVLCAEDGFEGLIALKRALPDVIISDLRMPNMNGFEFLSVVRRRFPAIPVVVVSGEFSGLSVPESVLVECPVIFGPVHMRETLSQGAGHGTKEEAHS